MLCTVLCTAFCSVFRVLGFRTSSHSAQAVGSHALPVLPNRNNPVFVPALTHRTFANRSEPCTSSSPSPSPLPLLHCLAQAPRRKPLRCSNPRRSSLSTRSRLKKVRRSTPFLPPMPATSSPAPSRNRCRRKPQIGRASCRERV